jgi:hypothetical protein
MDTRLAELTEWVKTTLRVASCDIRPASADASFRRYFRVTYAGKTLIAMDAPPEREDSPRYIRIARLLHRVGMHVPQIVEADLARGYVLITDLGDRQYLQVLNDTNVDALYADALAATMRLQTTDIAEVTQLPPYDDAVLTRELKIFDEWFLGKHLGITLTPAQTEMLDATHVVLKRSALEQPRVGVHRDYHSRNLMVTPRDNPGVLDFQDALYGPITYDLVSLLRDCYIAWPHERVAHWVECHRAALVSHGVDVNDAGQFMKWFDLMGMQRHLKAIGIFARLNHRDGKPGYLKDIPRTLGYVVQVCGRYSELREMEKLLRELVVGRVSI